MFLNLHYDSIINTISAISTTLAVAVALYFSGKESRERLSNERISQSSKIYVEKKNKPLTVDIDIRIVNNSDLPIFNVFITTVFNKGFQNKNIPIESMIKGANLPKHFISIMPGETVIPFKSNGSSMGGGTELPIIFFTDTKNNGWFINKYGQLIQINDYEKKYINNFLRFHPPY